MKWKPRPEHIDLLIAMTMKEFKGRYKRAFFGFLWILINPILQMLVIGVVFSFFVKIQNYFLFLFVGLLPWQFFSISVTNSTTSLVNQRTLLFKTKFPVATIPLSIVLSNFLHLLISFTLFLPIYFYMGKLHFFQVFLVLLGYLGLLVITSLVSLIASALYVKYRDVSFFVQTLLSLLFYATPILYGLNFINKSYLIYYSLNPLAMLFESFRKNLLGDGQVIGWAVLIGLIEMSILAVVTKILWDREKKYFTDWL